MRKNIRQSSKLNEEHNAMQSLFILSRYLVDFTDGGDNKFPERHFNHCAPTLDHILPITNVEIFKLDDIHQTKLMKV